MLEIFKKPKNHIHEKLLINDELFTILLILDKQQNWLRSCILDIIYHVNSIQYTFLTYT